jgi:UTP--glucose-1-phosphate uridylyltransferase
MKRISIVAVYKMTPKVFSAIEQVRPSVNNEIQLTDAIQVLVDQYDSVYALELGAGERRIEIGDSLSYRKAFFSKNLLNLKACVIV